MKVIIVSKKVPETSPLNATYKVITQAENVATVVNQSATQFKLGFNDGSQAVYNKDEYTIIIRG